MAEGMTITPEKIRAVGFEKVMRGYRPEDVDDYLQQVAGSMQQLAEEKEAAQTAQKQAEEALSASESKMLVLAQKIEEYRAQEDTLKTALINAQRMGETVVHEAKQKADNMVREANGTAQLLREQAESEIARERLTLEKLQSEVARFKSSILNLYKQHIESLSALDEPVHQIDELMEEYQVQRASAPPEPTEPEANTFAAEEPELPAGSIEMAHEADLETELPAEDPPAGSMFGGVQISD